MLLLALALLLSAAPARAVRESTLLRQPDADTAQLLREWILDGTSDDPLLRTEKLDYVVRVSRDPFIDPWMRYLGTTARKNADERERGLRAILDSPIPDSLRRVVLLDIQSDAAHGGSQARFIRRYGFYSNWFNRIFYVASRAVQGNVQAVGQIGVDLVYDLFAPKTASAAERKLYAALRRLEDEQRTTLADRERIAKLERKVDRALAAIDLERADQAMDVGNPHMAAFYAGAAVEREPEWGRARSALEEAESRAAERERRGIASAQVGYPDREPPIRPQHPELLRLVLAEDQARVQQALSLRSLEITNAARQRLPPELKRSAINLSGEELLMIRVIQSLSDRGKDSDTLLREWVSEARRLGVRGDSVRWMQALLLDPGFNPVVRFDAARAERRVSLLGFVFTGPGSTRSRSYVLSSRLAQFADALASVGIFYVAEVIYRMAVVVLSPPPPRDEVLDSAALFLQAAPEHPDAPAVALWLATQQSRYGKYDAARETLTEHATLDEETEREMKLSEARRYLEAGEKLEPGDPDRERLLRHAIELAPDTKLAETAEKRLAVKPDPEKPTAVRISWTAFARWRGVPPPCGLPGEAVWFDGRPYNGEFAGGEIRLERIAPPADPDDKEDAPDSPNQPEPPAPADEETAAAETRSVAAGDVRLSYDVDGEDEERVYVLTEAETDPELWALIGFCLGERELIVKDEIRTRPRIPYEFKGSAGTSGLDFYPRLLPLDPAELRLNLYQE